MTGYLIFIGCFFGLGLFYIVYGIIKLRKLNSESEDYLNSRKQYRTAIWKGFLLLLVGVWIYLTKIVWRAW